MSSSVTTQPSPQPPPPPAAPAAEPERVQRSLLGRALSRPEFGALAAAIVIALGLVMGYRPGGGAAGVIAGVALLLLFSFGVAWMWTALGLVLRSPSAVSNVIGRFGNFFPASPVGATGMPFWNGTFCCAEPPTATSSDAMPSSKKRDMIRAYCARFFTFLKITGSAL